MKFLLLELAINPDIQDRLRKEIQEHHENNQGKVDYEKLNEIKYLDMVLSGMYFIQCLDNRLLVL